MARIQHQSLYRNAGLSALSTADTAWPSRSRVEPPLAVRGQHAGWRRWLRAWREDQLTRTLRWRLPTSWTVCPDVLLTLDDGSWTRLDHVVVGDAGIYLLEDATRRRARPLARAASAVSPARAARRMGPYHPERRFRFWLLQQEDLADLAASVAEGLVVQAGRREPTARPAAAKFPNAVQAARWLMDQDRQRDPLDAILRAQFLHRLLGQDQDRQRSDRI